MDVDVDMTTEVFETPDPEVTLQPYAAVSHAHRAGAAPEDAHFYDKSNSELNEDVVAPAKAFEVFMGKVYKPAGRLPTQTEFEAPGGLASPSASLALASPKRDLESPLARFTRLTMEVKELESDLSLLAASADAKKAALLVDAAQEAEHDEVLRGLATLQTSLAAIEQNAAFRPFLHRSGGTGNGDAAASRGDSALALQRELTSAFFRQIEALKAQQQGTTAAALQSDTDTAAAAPIVYEIYSNGELNAVEKDAKTRTLALEARLATLEKAIGNFHVKELRADGLSALALSGSDLSSSVAQLEARVHLLNEKNLDAIKTRTTALIHEFTLLHKLKDAPSVQSALSAHADRDKIEQIYDKLASVDAVAGAVPALVNRLVALKAVHDDSLELGARVNKVEQSNATLAALLESDTALLENLEKSLAANVQIFQSNVQTLDDRMAQLLAAKRP